MVQEGTLLSWNEIPQAERVVSDHLPGQSDFIWAAIETVLAWFWQLLAASSLYYFSFFTRCE